MSAAKGLAERLEEEYGRVFEAQATVELAIRTVNSIDGDEDPLDLREITSTVAWALEGAYRLLDLHAAALQELAQLAARASPGPRAKAR